MLSNRALWARQICHLPRSMYPKMFRSLLLNKTPTVYLLKIQTINIFLSLMYTYPHSDMHVFTIQIIAFLLCFQTAHQSGFFKNLPFLGCVHLLLWYRVNRQSCVFKSRMVDSSETGSSIFILCMRITIVKLCQFIQHLTMTKPLLFLLARWYKLAS